MNINDIKEKIKNIHQSNKKLSIIIIGLSIIILVMFLSNSINTNDKENNNLGFPSNHDIQIVLFGDNKITVYKGERYIEPGYYAISDSGEIKTSEVVVINQVDTNKVGSYIITYILGDKKLSRTVEVIEKEEVIEGTLSFDLNGDTEIILNQGDIYVEPGFFAHDSEEGDLTNSVIISGNVDTSKIGTYTLTYSIKNKRGVTKSIIRKIIVKKEELNVSLSISNNNYTNDDIYVTVNASSNNFSYVKYPDNTVSSEQISNYKISQNGNYKFYIYDKNNNFIVKTVNITNIDKEKPVASCQAKIENGKTYINVVASDSLSGIQKYDYYENNKLLISTKNNNYTNNSKLTDVLVLVYDKVANVTSIKCEVLKQEELEVHFINVGREDAILIRSSESTILIDGGRYSKREIITPYLKELGVKKIDALIGSHLHYNHIQAQADIIENFVVDKIYYPQDLRTCYSVYCELDDQKYILDAIKKYNKEISIMKANDNIKIGDINIFSVGPLQFKTRSQDKYAQNYNSLNFILTYGKTKFMFTGDNMQSSNILKSFSKNILDVDVLKYPHHGNCSVDEELINTMSPMYTVLTSTYDELNSRVEKKYLEDVNSKFYYSYKHGNILMISDGEDIIVETNVNPSDYKK